MTPSLLLVLAVGAAPKHLAVLELEGEGLTPSERKSLTEIFTEEVASHFEGRVFSKNEIKEMLLREERLQTLEKCDSTSCYAEIALALGAELMIEGSVTKLGDSVTMTASLIDATDAEVAARASLEWNGPAAGLADVARALAQRLMVKEHQRKPGVLRLTAETPGASVTVDGRPAGIAPVGQVEGLDVGVHLLTAEAPDYLPLSRPFVVQHGRDTVLDVGLEAPESKPVYAKWWFWVIAGGVAAGATTGIVLAAGSGGGDPDPTGSLDVRWQIR